MNRIRIFVVIAFALLMSACTHPISIKPGACDLGRCPTVNADAVIVISQSDYEQKVKETGPGGDSYEYTPYQDLYYGLKLNLGKVFKDVSRAETLTSKPNTYYFEPMITTKSEAGFMMWPPTDFTIDLQCTVFDAQGGKLQNLSVIGHGTAATNQFIQNFGYAGMVAMEDAIKKLVGQIDFAKVQSTGGTGSNLKSYVE